MHPLLKDMYNFANVRIYKFTNSSRHRDVAQSGSATVWGTGGRKFESCHPDEESVRALFLYLYFSYHQTLAHDQTSPKAAAKIRLFCDIYNSNGFICRFSLASPCIASPILSGEAGELKQPSTMKGKGGAVATLKTY